MDKEIHAYIAVLQACLQLNGELEQAHVIRGLAHTIDMDAQAYIDS